MHAAQHDSVNGAEPRYTTYTSTLDDPRADAEAAHQVLAAFFPANQAALDDQLEKSLSGIPDGDAEDAGVALARAVGELVLAARADDGFGTPDPFSPAPGLGIWQPTPPALAPMLEPQFQNVAPFTLRDRRQFLPDPPRRSRAGGTPVTTRRSSSSVIGMRAHGSLALDRFGDGELEGWSAMQFIETSSITLHADEVFGRCFVDVFSCKPFDPDVAAAIAVEHFGGRSAVTVLQR